MTLYKYLQKERIDVLQNREIRFTQAAALNDPFEINPYLDTLVRRSTLTARFAATPPDPTPNLIEWYSHLPPEQKKRLPLDDVLRAAKEWMSSAEGKRQLEELIGIAADAMKEVTEETRDSLFRRLRTEIGILSLSEIADGALLWAHYASDHQGFVIGFDESSRLLNSPRAPQDEFFRTRKVNYTTPVEFADLEDLANHNLLISKAPDWEHEREWRVLVPITAATRTIAAPDPIHLVAFDPSAIQTVILGTRATADFELAIKQALSIPEYSHVSLRRARLDRRASRIAIT